MDNSDRSPLLVSVVRKARSGNDTAEARGSSQCARSVTSIAIATRMDPAGRVLVPVRINERGPYYLVVNTGASTVALSAHAARSLNLPLENEPCIVVHGVTGSLSVPVVRVTSVQLGGWMIPTTTMPIFGDVFEGADGMLGLMGLVSGQVHMDLRRRQLILSNMGMRNRASPSAASLPMEVSQSRLIVVEATVMGTLVKAIIDTGAQSTIGNLPLQHALGGIAAADTVPIPIIGMTSHRKAGVSQRLPPVRLGTLCILGARILYGDVPLLERVGFANTPAMFLGMDVLGQMQSMTFNYSERLVHFVPRSGKSKSRRRHVGHGH